MHTLICRGSGLPLFFLLSPANMHDAPFAKILLAGAVHFYRIRPSIVRLDAAYWGLRLIAFRFMACLVPSLSSLRMPETRRNRSCLPPTWTTEELGLPQ